MQFLKISDISSSKFVNLRVGSEVGEDLAGLVSSIRRYGVLEPIIVRRRKEMTDAHTGQKFEIICGHRRYEACKKVPVQTVPCIVGEFSDQEALEVALAENMQRKNLTPIEEAEAFKLYILFFGRGSVSRLARKIGKSEEYVSHRVLLLGLPNAIRERISRRLLKAGEATELVWLKDPEKQIRLTEEMSHKPLSFRQLRVAVGLMKSSNVAASEAVRRALLAKSQHFRAEGTSGSSSIGDLGEYWSSPQTYSEKKDPQVDLLDRAILVMHTSLSGLNLVIEQAVSGRLHELLMHHRNIVHEALDELIREKLRYTRRAQQQFVSVD